MLGHHGPKQLLTRVWNAETSREALLETISEGLSATDVGGYARGARVDWQPWKTLKELSNDTITLTDDSGVESAVPALHFASRTFVTETQRGVGQTFTGKTTVTLDALAGYSAPIDEYTILLAFGANPGWMSRGSEMLVYQTVTAVREAIAGHLHVPTQPCFSFIGGGWANVDLSSFGNLI